MVYTRTQLKSDINRGIQNKKGMLIDFGDTCNNAVRRVVADLDLRSLRRKADLQPKLFNNVFDYAWPTDGKGYGIIDIQAGCSRENRNRTDTIVHVYNGVTEIALRILDFNGGIFFSPQFLFKLCNHRTA